VLGHQWRDMDRAEAAVERVRVKPSQDDYRGLWLNIPCAVAREAS
jgi:hypothetical protein